MTKNESFEILAIANSEFHGSEISLCQNVSSEIPFVRRQRIPLWLHTQPYIEAHTHIHSRSFTHSSFDHTLLVRRLHFYRLV